MEPMSKSAPMSNVDSNSAYLPCVYRRKLYQERFVPMGIMFVLAPPMSGATRSGSTSEELR